MKNRLKKNKIDILWTGGWDSTYRIIELSFLDVCIQPIYVIDKKRNSRFYELNAMKKIVELLKCKKNTKAEFLPISKIKIEDIPKDEEITEAYKRIAEVTDLGSQHDWLARLSKMYPDLELCIEKGFGDHTPVRDAITKGGKLIKTKYGEKLDKFKSTKDLNLVFGNFILPIFQITEKEMLENIKKWKYEDVMANIWFCHTPIKNMPCGTCNPCCTKMSYGMDFLLPKEAQKRYKNLNKIGKLFGRSGKKLYKKIIRVVYK